MVLLVTRMVCFYKLLLMTVTYPYMILYLGKLKSGPTVPDSIAYV